MKVTFFKSHLDTAPTGHFKNVNHFLDRIRRGESAKEVILYRSTGNKEIKSKLPCIAFGGTFEKRAKSGLKQASGLLILDIDNCEDLNFIIDTFQANEYTYSCWVSPSGTGLKVLIKIPVVENDEEYKSYFNGAVKYFDFVEIDKSGKDISRLCYESYDPEIYINENSKVFVEIDSTENINQSIGVVTNIPIVDQDEIANRLMIWFKKHFDSSARNNSFHKLALAFNDFGIERYICERYLFPNAQKDFPESEIKLLINSAYKHTSSFGTKFFEDKITQKKIKGLVSSGKSIDEIHNVFNEIPKEKIKSEIEVLKNTIDLDEFWFTDEKGTLKISPHRFKFYLENNNYFKFYPISGKKIFSLLLKEGNFVDDVNEFEIKDFVLNEQLRQLNYDQFDLLASSTKVFTPAFLSMLDTANVTIEEDGKDYAMLYFNNTAVRVYQNKIESISYDDLEGVVWKKQVADRNFKKNDHHKSEYRSFLWYACGRSIDKYNSLKSIVGYLLHSYKTSANNKAIILADETISDNPNGGSGKSLFCQSLGYMKKLATIDGKSFDFQKSFPYQTVPTDTQVLLFDDVKKNFIFESLFSIITQGITLEYKGQDAIRIPVEKSPKILITTNYTIKGTGGSFLRRKHEFEFSSYFNDKHTPLDHFGHLLFDSWDEDEWSRFDNYLINCLQYYFENGLIVTSSENLHLKNFINETSSEFYEYVTDSNNNLKVNQRISKTMLFEEFTEEFKDVKKWLSQKKFTQWVQIFANFKGYKYSEGNTNGMRWYELSTNNVNEEIEDDGLPF